MKALAAVRATREATVRRNGESLPCILGVPQEGELLDDHLYDGKEEIALFPGDLPENPQTLFHMPEPDEPAFDALRFLRFRPPPVEVTAEGVSLSLPHIRLDRALDFLIGDRLA